MERRRVAARAAQEATHPLLAPRLLHVRRRGEIAGSRPPGAHALSHRALAYRGSAPGRARPSPLEGRADAEIDGALGAVEHEAADPRRSMSVRRKQAKASCGVHTIGSPDVEGRVHQHQAAGQAMERAQPRGSAARRCTDRLDARGRVSTCVTAGTLERATSGGRVRSPRSSVDSGRSWALAGERRTSCRDSDDRARSTRRSALPEPQARTAGSPRGTCLRLMRDRDGSGRRRMSDSQRAGRTPCVPGTTR